MKKKLPILVIGLISLILLSLSIKGQYIAGVLEFQNNFATTTGGPYELSINTGRYALTRSIVDNHSFILSKDLAQFAAPDVSELNGKFISIFTPGVSFISIPFYLVGKQLGIPQITTYLMNTLFALLNIIVIATLAKKFGASRFASILAGLIFVFATIALPFTQSFTQHLTSAFILVSIIVLATNPKKKRNLFFAGLLYGAGFLVDFPNVLLNLPAILYILVKQFDFQITERIDLKINLSLVLFALGFFPLLVLFGYYNFATTGSYFKLAQSIGKTKVFDKITIQRNKSPETNDDSSRQHNFSLKSLIPFDTRKELNGLYILGLSNERSWIFYSPIILFGFLGLYFSARNPKYRSISVLAVATIVTNFLIYSSFGDPWGGWSFGPRYLIPASAILAATIPVVFEKFKSKFIFWIVFIFLLYYSIAVNTIGVLTSIAIPPKVEAVALKPPTKYSVDYSLGLLQNGMNNSLIYSYILFSKISPEGYATAYFILIAMFLSIVAMLGLIEKESHE